MAVGGCCVVGIDLVGESVLVLFVTVAARIEGISF